MRIAIVAPTEIPARRANTLQVMKMAQALVILGHQVRLAAPSYPQASILGSKGHASKVGYIDMGNHASVSYTWQDLARHYGLTHEFPIDWLPANPRLRRYDYSLRGVQWAQRWKADLLYTRLPQAATLASILGAATILEVHDLPQGILGPWLLRLFLSGKGARRLVAITKALAQDISQKSGAPATPPFTVTAPDGVDLERYAQILAPAEARLALGQGKLTSLPVQIPPDRLTAGYTGHLYPGRGIELLLTLAERLPEITFLIVGGEPQDVARLQTQVESIPLENVILTGFIPNAELPHYQAACDILLMPYQRRVAASSGGDISRYLSPMKLFEYMACERAILCGDLPVLREVLNPQNAVLLPNDDADAWASAIKSLGNDPKRRSLLAGQARLDVNHYTWEARAVRILEGLENGPLAEKASTT
jgi:glycosyltransferase involved in cell wall biosynthesis